MTRQELALERVRKTARELRDAANREAAALSVGRRSGGQLRNVTCDALADMAEALVDLLEDLGEAAALAKAEG